MAGPGEFEDLPDDLWEPEDYIHEHDPDYSYEGSDGSK